MRPRSGPRKRNERQLSFAYFSIQSRAALIPPPSAAGRARESPRFGLRGIKTVARDFARVGGRLISTFSAKTPCRHSDRAGKLAHRGLASAAYVADAMLQPCPSLHFESYRDCVSDMQIATSCVTRPNISSAELRITCSQKRATTAPQAGSCHAP